MEAKITQEMLERAIDLQRKCWSHERIATELGVHRVTISRRLSRHNRRMMEAFEKRAIATKARQLAQLEWFICELVESWEKSKLDAVSLKTTTEKVSETPDVPDSEGYEVKTERTVKGQAGSPGYLAEARAAMADVRKLLKIGEAEDDEPDFSQMSREELRAYVARRGKGRPSAN